MKKASGKKPRELIAWQVAAVDVVARSALGTKVTGGKETGHLDLSHYPFDPIDRPVLWSEQGLNLPRQNDQA